MYHRPAPQGALNDGSLLQRMRDRTTITPACSLGLVVSVCTQDPQLPKVVKTNGGANKAVRLASHLKELGTECRWCVGLRCIMLLFWFGRVCGGGGGISPNPNLQIRIDHHNKRMLYSTNYNCPFRSPQSLDTVNICTLCCLLHTDT